MWGVTHVEEEVGEDVARKETAFADLVVAKAHDAEDDGENRETAELDRFTTDGIASSDRDPVTGNGTGTDQDQVARSNVEESFVGVGTLAIANGCKNRSVIETNTVESDIEEEPGTGGT